MDSKIKYSGQNWAKIFEELEKGEYYDGKS